jgi:hypothetical protein
VGILQERYGLATHKAHDSLDKFIADLKPPTKSV